MMNQSGMAQPQPKNQNLNTLNTNHNNPPYQIHIHFRVWLLQFSIIWLSLLAKIFYSVERNDVGKESFKTGIPFLRNYFLVVPSILAIGLFVFYVLVFSASTQLKAKCRNSIIIFLKRNKCFYLFTNILHVLCYYFVYYCLYLPLLQFTGYKLSGHTLTSILANGMLINIAAKCKSMIKENVKPKQANILFYLCWILRLHNYYVFFWSCYAFHGFFDVLISYFIAVPYVIIIHFMNVDSMITDYFDDTKDNYQVINIKKSDGLHSN